MTTIVVDCKEGIIAADGQTTSYDCDRNGKPITHTTGYNDSKVKVRKCAFGVFAGAGNADAISNEYDHFSKHGCLRGKPSGDFTIVVARRKGSHIHVDIHSSDEYTTWYGVKKYKMSTTTQVSDRSIITFGSGGNYAYAGTKMGLSARDAIELASWCDPYTNCNITVEEI